MNQDDVTKPLTEIEKAELLEIVSYLSSSQKIQLDLRRAFFEIDLLKNQIRNKE